MRCAGCGDSSAWFTEERQVIAASAPPASGPYAVYPAEATATRWVYRCAQCGLVYGEEPKRKKGGK